MRKWSQHHDAKRQHGQSMVEFTVVVVFFCLAVTSDPALNAIERLLDVMQQRFEHYSYTVSLSDYPDTSVYEEMRALLIEQLQAQGYSNEEIEQYLAEKSGQPVSEWVDLFEGYTGESFPQVPNLPEMTAGALASGNPEDFFQ